MTPAEIAAKLTPAHLQVSRYSVFDQDTQRYSGDFIQVGPVDLGSFRDLTNAEYERCKLDYPANPAFAMRPMWHTGSAFGADILALAVQVRGLSVLAALDAKEAGNG